MMVASGEWARWRGPQEKEYRGGAHRRKIPSSGRGGGQRVVVLVSRHQQPHAHARTRPPLPGPAGARPCRPTVVARAAVVLSPRTSASLHFTNTTCCASGLSIGSSPLEWTRSGTSGSFRGLDLHASGDLDLHASADLIQVHSFFSNLQTKNRSDTCD